MLFVKLLKRRTLVSLDIMIRDPKPRNTPPEISRKLAQRMKKAIPNNLPQRAKSNIPSPQQGDVHKAKHGHCVCRKQDKPIVGNAKISNERGRNPIMYEGSTRLGFPMLLHSLYNRVAQLDDH